MFHFNFILVNILLYTNVISCEKKPLYHEPSKEVYKAGISLPDDALFGYSITYQSMSKKIIVGAPRADLQGEVFECDRSGGECNQINITIKTGKEGLFTYSWLGATVRAGSDFFMTCAPRSSGRGFKAFMTSQCFYQSVASGNVKKIKELTNEYKKESYKRFSNTTKVNYENLYDTLGWSMDVSSDDVTILGGPGGAMGSTLARAFHTNYFGPEVRIYAKSCRASLIPKKKTDNQILIDQDRNNTDLAFYGFGYSVKAGKFLDSEVYAISSPYGAIGQGKVLFFSKNREFMQAVVDNEVGAIFGGALCNARLGENGSSEALLVGAPASAHRHGDVDVGAVHVYVNEAGKMLWKHTIPGYKNNGYFGYAIVSVGDLNLDGKDEVVISAPYENEYRGAVYIFSGADLMKNTSSDIQWLQRFEGDAPNQTLGLSLAAVPDLDGNGCNELSIGAAGNNSVILMNCITYITFTLYFNDVSPTIVEHKDSRSLHMEACVDLTDNKILKQKVENKLAVKIKLIHPNATLVEPKDKILTYEVSLADLNLTDCRKFEIMLPDNGNYDETMVLQMNASLYGDDARNMTKFKSGLVMVTEETQTYLEEPLKYQVPGSNLTMDLSTTFEGNNIEGYKYKIGSTQRETLTFEVQNAASSRSAAYRACLRVSIEGVGVARASQNCAVADNVVTCQPKNEPILPGKSMVVNITLDTKTLTGEAESIEIKSRLDAHCDDQISYTVERIEARITLQKDYDIIVIGESTPSTPVNVSREEIAFGYENIRHVYSVRNSGVTAWGKVSCDLSVPEYVSFSITNPHEGVCRRLHNKNEAKCEFKLASNDTKDIIVQMDVLPHTRFTEEVLKGKASKLETELSCKVKYGEVMSRITTTMKLLPSKSIPLYIWVIAAVVGLLLLLLLAFILYECGFLRRKHKEELVALKKDVRRQSIRRSMRLRESMKEENDDHVEPTNQEGDAESVVTTDVTKILEVQDRISKAVIHCPPADVH